MLSVKDLLLVSSVAAFVALTVHCEVTGRDGAFGLEAGTAIPLAGILEAL
jgi:hypothetical protein